MQSFENQIMAVIIPAGRITLSARLQLPAEAKDFERFARARKCCERTIEIVPGADCRFEDRGALDHGLALAARWFGEHLRKDANIAA
jgi:hypothetical protein